MELESALREFQVNLPTLESMSTLDQEKKTLAPPEPTTSSLKCSEEDQLTDQRLNSTMLSLIWELSTELMLEEKSPILISKSIRETAPELLSSLVMLSATQLSTLPSLSSSRNRSALSTNSTIPNTSKPLLRTPTSTPSEST